MATTYAHYLATVKLRDTALEAVEADLLPWCTQDPFVDQVQRLAAYRGVTRIGALCLAAEVFDWRRFPKARPFMSFTGLVPGENSTGLSSDGARSPGPATPTCGPALRSGLGLPAQPQRRGRHQGAPEGRVARDGGSFLGGTSPSVQAVPTTGCPQERSLRGCCRHRR